MPKQEYTREQLFNAIAEQGDDAMRFEMTRDPEPGVTFSAEGIKDMGENIAIFLGARVKAHWEAAGYDKPGPSSMHVRVEVSLDNEHWDVGDDPWFTYHDGAHRAGGLD